MIWAICHSLYCKHEHTIHDADLSPLLFEIPVLICCHSCLIFLSIGECSVIVSVGDENDNVPSFNNLPNSSATVLEGAAANTEVYTVKVRSN